MAEKQTKLHKKTKKPSPVKADSGPAKIHASDNSVVDGLVARALDTPQGGLLNNPHLSRVQRQELARSIGQMRGNQQLSQLLQREGEASQDESIQRQEDGDGVGNPLVGLKNRDGLDVGTWERRPRVKLLQDKLNQKMLGGLNIDGMFGNKTLEVLQEFQLSIDVPPQEMVDPVTADALMGEKKKEQPPQPVPPTPGGFNAGLEDILDAVWNANHFILLARRDGLARLRRQLKKGAVTRFSDDLKPKLTDAASQGLHKATDTQRDELITGLVGETAKDVVVKVLDAGFTPAVTLLVEGAIDLAVELFAPEPRDAPDDAAVDVFVEGQTKTVTDAAFQAEQEYLTKGKQEFRDKEAAEPGQGLAQAQELLAQLKTKQKASEEAQYNQSMTTWMIMMAQEDLGKVPIDEITQKDLGTEMGDLSKVQVARGVLKIRVFGLSPNNPLVIDPSQQPRMAGMSDAARDNLAKRKINDMGMPILAEGDNLGTLRPDPENPQGKKVEEDFNFRINEKDTMWGWERPMDVKIWLQQKKAGNEPAPAPGDDQAAVEGLLIALRKDVGEQTLSGLGLKIEDE